MSLNWIKPDGQARSHILRAATWHHASAPNASSVTLSRVGTLLGFRRQLTDLSTLQSNSASSQPAQDSTAHTAEPHDESGAPLEARVGALFACETGPLPTQWGGGSSFFDMQFHLPLAKTSLIVSRPTQGTLWHSRRGNHAPGVPIASVSITDE